MKKIMLGLCAFVALGVSSTSFALFEKKTLTVFSAINASTRISVTYNDPCEHWNDTVGQCGSNSRTEHCAWTKFEGWVQLPSGEVPVQGLSFNKLDEIYEDDVVVLYGPLNGKYFAERVTTKGHY